MIAVVNYGLGNVQAILNIYHRLGMPAEGVTSAEQLLSADKIVLPGVGAFDWAMSRLSDSGMKDVLTARVLDNKVPVLGICVGMQMLASCSEEGTLPGLNWIPGEVKKFAPKGEAAALPLPHMGWNSTAPVERSELFAGFESDPRFYFLHSFYFAPSHSEDVLSITSYGGKFAASVRRDNIYGVQFHPEKSHEWGIQLLKNFGAM
jgi:glutamine amidotransferase